MLLPLLALLALGGHVLMSRPKGRGLLRVGLGLAVTGLLLLAAVGIGRSAYLGAIDQNVLPRQAAADIFDSLIALLRSALRITVHRRGGARRAQPADRRAGTARGRGERPAVARRRGRVRADPRTEWLAAQRRLRPVGDRAARRARARGLGQPDGAVVVLIDAALIALAVVGRRARSRTVNAAPAG